MGVCNEKGRGVGMDVERSRGREVWLSGKLGGNERRREDSSFLPYLFFHFLFFLHGYGWYVFRMQNLLSMRGGISFSG